jgi:hypothetical protein
MNSSIELILGDYASIAISTLKLILIENTNKEVRDAPTRYSMLAF